MGVSAVGVMAVKRLWWCAIATTEVSISDCDHGGDGVVNISVVIYCSIMPYFRAPSDFAGR